MPRVGTRLDQRLYDRHNTTGCIAVCITGCAAFTDSAMLVILKRRALLR